MFIQYTGTNVHAIGLINKTNLKMNQSPQEVLGIMPGWNEIPTEIWKQNETSPAIQHLLKSGKLIVLKEKAVVMVRGKNGKKTKKAIEVGLHDKPMKLSWFKDEKFIVDTLIKKTFNRTILQRWADEEMRPKIRKALNMQLKPLLSNGRDESEPSPANDVEDFD